MAADTDLIDYSSNPLEGEFESSATLYRAARYRVCLIDVKIRASPILKDPRESKSCRDFGPRVALQAIPIPKR
jgi:hypothetical protein